MNTTIIIFIILILLCLLVLANSRNQNITSIYSRENFYADEQPVATATTTTAATSNTSADMTYDPNKINNYEKNYERISGVLYSGDILDITDSKDKGNYMSRQDYNSQIVMAKPEEKGLTTNLSKLRIVSVKHNDKSIQYPIQYGDVVVISHNAYIENINSVRYIKYGDKLQSHQDGEMFRTFKIINPTNSKDTGYVQYNQPVFLQRSEISENVFMTIEKDNTISTKNGINTATNFYIKLKRVYEAYEKNLCICVGELLYP